ncbi:MAG: hypothetical protein MZV70_04930 [Desulfobacterales bacterium]|nr:hypothetical protein [Desulfobacterales bacterium]
MVCAGLGVAFGKLAEPQPDYPFARARRAAAYLGQFSTSDAKALGYFDKYDSDADKIGTPHPKSIDEAIDWLTTAVVQAGRELQDSFLKAQLKPERLSFSMLHQIPQACPAYSGSRQTRHSAASQTRRVCEAAATAQ